MPLFKKTKTESEEKQPVSSEKPYPTQKRKDQIETSHLRSQLASYNQSVSTDHMDPPQYSEAVGNQYQAGVGPLPHQGYGPPPPQGYGPPPPQGYGPPPPQGYGPPPSLGYGPPPPQGYGPPPSLGYGPPPPQGYGPPPSLGYGPPPPQGYAPPVPAPAPKTTVVVKSGFDAGARFDGIAQPTIPPPPPGCMPNAAQLAAAQGQNVVVTQKKGDFWSGGSDGGYVIF